MRSFTLRLWPFAPSVRRPGKTIGKAAIARRLAAFALALLLVVPSAQSGLAEPLVAYDAKIAGDDARTRIVLDFDRKPEFALHYVMRPNRVIIDLSETQFGFDPSGFQATGLFSDIRYGLMGEGQSRLVLTAARPLKVTRAEVLENAPGKGWRLSIDAEMTTPEAYAALVAGQDWSGLERVAGGKVDRIGATAIPVKPDSFLVAVDAGHGGIDTGATGPVTKVQEKDVTLAFARELADKLNAEPGIRAFLVRDKDAFISLSERVTIARQQGANLLISLHADVLRQKDIRGATVYTISDKASDRLAAELAERENLSDDIGGVEFKDEPEEVTDILIDLTRRETQAFSIRLAEAVVKSFEGQIGLINNPHRHAGFRVLRAPDVPSILLELGFLSNPEDEKLLTDPEWRLKVADRLVESIRTFRSDELANGG